MQALNVFMSTCLLACMHRFAQYCRCPENFAHLPRWKRRSDVACHGPSDIGASLLHVHQRMGMLALTLHVPVPQGDDSIEIEVNPGAIIQTSKRQILQNELQEVVSPPITIQQAFTNIPARVSWTPPKIWPRIWIMCLPITQHCMPFSLPISLPSKIKKMNGNTITRGRPYYSHSTL
eukprot:SAG11_NODE_5620_length_1506_cov_0.844350_2_plen_176_part_01